MHYFGARIFAQLGSGLGRQGRVDKLEDPDVQLYSASPTSYHTAKEMIPESMQREFDRRGLEYLKHTLSGPMTRAATLEEINVQKEAYGKAAKRVVNMGFDGIEIYFGGGYFGFSFLSPRLNKRTDEYGGSRENRMRYLMDNIRNVRQTVPDDFVVGIRVSIEEHMPGGLTREDTKVICKEAEALGVDYISLEDGTWESMKHYLPDKPGELVDPVAEIKRELKIPVICGSMGDANKAEAAIKDGRIDMAGIGRPLIADPEWTNKVAAGKKPIKCIRCNIGCWQRLVELSLPIRCTVNPECGYEQYNPEFKMSKPRKAFWKMGGTI
ncbi:MAG: hypothetical protein JRI52_04975 [Deltaproteobacteria bacterium]|nr:hypothetical protein [Deltaproteobacteria bacterium]